MFFAVFFSEKFLIERNDIEHFLVAIWNPRTSFKKFTQYPKNWSDFSVFQTGFQGKWRRKTELSMSDFAIIL